MISPSNVLGFVLGKDRGVEQAGTFLMDFPEYRQNSMIERPPSKLSPSPNRGQVRISVVLLVLRGCHENVTFHWLLLFLIQRTKVGEGHDIEILEERTQTRDSGWAFPVVY